jgi:hypothetical protein
MATNNSFTKRNYVIDGHNDEKIYINYNYNPDTGKLVYGSSVCNKNKDNVRRHLYNAMRKYELFPVTMNTPCWMHESEIDDEIRQHMYSNSAPIKIL